MFLKVYVDESGINEPPVSVMAGWVADPSQWSAFTAQWDEVLRMSPRIELFKYSEARGASPFGGMSPERRDEKLRLLMQVIKDSDLRGVHAAIKHDTFHRHFGAGSRFRLRTPYLLLLIELYSLIHRHFGDIEGRPPVVDMIFDEQRVEEEDVVSSWRAFHSDAPEPFRSMFAKRPTFQDDRRELPLQAADFLAGWMRELDAATFAGSSVDEPVWFKQAKGITVFTRIIGESAAEDMVNKLMLLSAFQSLGGRS